MNRRIQCHQIPSILLLWLSLTTSYFLQTVKAASARIGNEKSPYSTPSWDDVMAIKKGKKIISTDDTSFRPTTTTSTTTNFEIITPPPNDQANNNSTIFAASSALGGDDNDDDIYFMDNHRQGLCVRYQQVQDGTIPLRDALQGLQLRPLMRVGKFFQYTEEDGIDPLDPGLLALMMDELARRAGFTWRDSFGVVFGLPERPPDTPDDETIAFTDLLKWSVETYDLSCNWWDETLERLELGIAFQKPWFDGSIIMVQKQSPPEIDENAIEIWNWLRPFNTEVWIVTVFTIIFSGMAYQWLEHLSGHRRHRSWWQWFSDNVYLSAISFPQNYEFQPRSAGARIFGVSISLWALVMTATYTANLASLLVEHQAVPLVVEDITDAVTMDVPVCVYEGTGADAYIKSKYKQARRVPYDTELGSYQGLQEGSCELNLAYYQNWLGFASQKAYNPSCDLEWVGRTIKTIQSGFANSADVGIKCTSLIGNVLDIYLNELLASGFIEDMWEKQYDKTRDINCDAVSPQVLERAAGTDSSAGRRRRSRRMMMEQQVPQHQSQHPYYGEGRAGQERRRLADQIEEGRRGQEQKQRGRRRLKPGVRGGAAGAAAAVGDGNMGLQEGQMTLNQMAGTFILHYWVTGVAIVVGYIRKYFREKDAAEKKRASSSKSDGGMDESAKFVNRRWVSHRFTNESRNDTSIRYSITGWDRSVRPRSGRHPARSSADLGKYDDDDDDNNSTATKEFADMGRQPCQQRQRRTPKRSRSFDSSYLSSDDGDSVDVGYEDRDQRRAWEQTYRELLEAKRELRETKNEIRLERKETKEQMDLILRLLIDKRQETAFESDGCGGGGGGGSLLMNKRPKASALKDGGDSRSRLFAKPIELGGEVKMEESSYGLSGETFSA